MEYTTNPSNAVQIDPPGAMDKSDLSKIDERINSAATNYGQEGILQSIPVIGELFKP